MKKLEELAGVICLILAVILAVMVFAKSSADYNGLPTLFFNSSGQIKNRQYVIWDDNVTPTTAMGNTIDISNAGFTTILSCNVTPAQNTTSITAIPLISIQTVSTTTITVNILSSSSTVISVLGGTVTGLTAATGLSTMKLHIHCVGLK